MTFSIKREFKALNNRRWTLIAFLLLSAIDVFAGKLTKPKPLLVLQPANQTPSSVIGEDGFFDGGEEDIYGDGNSYDNSSSYDSFLETSLELTGKPKQIKQNGKCLSASLTVGYWSKQYDVGQMEKCDDGNKKQKWIYSKNSRELRQDGKCFGVGGNYNVAYLTNCNGNSNQKWDYDQDKKALKQGGRCLDQGTIWRGGTRKPMLYLYHCHHGWNQKFTGLDAMITSWKTKNKPHKECGDPVGVTRGGRIGNNAFRSSSVWKLTQRAWDARLNGPTGWCAAGKKNQWIQVDLGEEFTITGVATQGNHAREKFMWVTKYKVRYSNEEGEKKEWTDWKGGKTKTGNDDKDTVVKWSLDPPFVARWVRIQPVETEERACLRFELYGCPDLTGSRGKRGEVGFIGERGMQGRQGKTGAQGDAGQNGVKGPLGKRGVAGMQGAAGLRGAEGLKGMRGDFGKAGAKGNAGPQGKEGYQGPKGKPGRDGFPGTPGKRGNQGRPGRDGPRGGVGKKGDRGKNGIPGNNGKDGLTGDPGNNGDSAPAGEPGMKGDRGPRGGRGPIGPPGTDGQDGLQGDRGDTGQEEIGGEEANKFKIRQLNKQMDTMEHQLKDFIFMIEAIKTKKGGKPVNAHLPLDLAKTRLNKIEALNKMDQHIDNLKNVWMKDKILQQAEDKKYIEKAKARKAEFMKRMKEESAKKARAEAKERARQEAIEKAEAAREKELQSQTDGSIASSEDAVDVIRKSVEHIDKGGEPRAVDIEEKDVDDLMKAAEGNALADKKKAAQPKKKDEKPAPKPAAAAAKAAAEKTNDKEETPEKKDNEAKGDAEDPEQEQNEKKDEDTEQDKTEKKTEDKDEDEGEER